MMLRVQVRPSVRGAGSWWWTRYRWWGALLRSGEAGARSITKRRSRVR